MLKQGNTQPQPETLSEAKETLFKGRLRSGKVRAKQGHKESDLQRAAVKWFRLQYSRYEFNLFAIPNEGRRKITTAMFLKSQGMRSGVPDLFLAIPRLHYSGLFIEMKVAPNKPTSNQLKMIEVLSNSGYLCKVCYTVEEFMNVVNQYLKN